MEPERKLPYEELLELDQIASELTLAFNKLENLYPAVVVIGSARLTPEDPYYQEAVEFGRQAAKNGYAVLTGGGPGIMEAANQGAQSAQGSSVGLCVKTIIPEQENYYIDDHYKLNFNHFFIRRLLFLRYAKILVCFPGGYGTLDELMEFLMMISTKRIPHIPIYLIGKEFWGNFVKWIKEVPGHRALIPQADLDLLHVTDNIEDVIGVMKKLK